MSTPVPPRNRGKSTQKRSSGGANAQKANAATATPAKKATASKAAAAKANAPKADNPNAEAANGNAPLDATATAVPPRRSSGGSRTRPPAHGGRQAAFQRKRRQQRWLFGGIGLVVVVVVALVIVAVTGGGGTTGGGPGVSAVEPAVLTALTSVPPQQLATVAKENPVLSPPVEIKNGPVLTAEGKPKVVYIGAEYCPYCGGERWAMIIALSKFGTFHNLKQLTSSSTDSPTSIPSFSFVGSTYTSKYLVFDPTEVQDVNRNPLQTPTKVNAELEAKYDAPPYTSTSGIPFIDFGGKWVSDGASFDVTPMQYLSHSTVAQAIQTGSTKYAADIQSTAGTMVSRLCNLTDGQPGNVCKYFPSVIG